MQIWCATRAFAEVGWGVAAFGDLYKSVVKAKEGKDAIVTGGPYALLRHPNYTGEQLLWSANFVAGLLAAATLHPVARSRHTKHLLQGLHGFHVLQSPKAILLTWLPLSALGLLGLEKRQREKYGEEEKCFEVELTKRSFLGLRNVKKEVLQADTDDSLFRWVDALVQVRH
eukprot:s436_g39.t1